MKNLVAQQNNSQELELRRIAKKRVGFKKHAFAYILVNAMIWGFWLFDAISTQKMDETPAGMTFFWGIGLAIHAISIYFRTAFISEESEYENLRRERGF